MNILDNRKILVEMKGGSWSYGLNTSNSDIDWSGIFVNTDAEHLVGLKKDEVLVSQNTEDKVYTEFRHALKLLRNGNTQMIELLFAEDFTIVTEEWMIVQKKRDFLVNSETFFKALKGYIFGELRLANGERTGRLGGKRKSCIDDHGFSEKNFVQLLRLAKAGAVYFKEGFFPVNIMKYSFTFGEQLLDIKMNPQNYTKEQLNRLVWEYEKQLDDAFQQRKSHHLFDESIATKLCLNVYGPLISIVGLKI